MRAGCQSTRYNPSDFAEVQELWQKTIGINDISKKKPEHAWRFCLMDILFFQTASRTDHFQEEMIHRRRMWRSSTDLSGRWAKKNRQAGCLRLPWMAKHCGHGCCYIRLSECQIKYGIAHRRQPSVTLSARAAGRSINDRENVYFTVRIFLQNTAKSFRYNLWPGAGMMCSRYSIEERCSVSPVCRSGAGWSRYNINSFPWHVYSCGRQKQNDWWFLAVPKLKNSPSAIDEISNSVTSKSKINRLWVWFQGSLHTIMPASKNAAFAWWEVWTEVFVQIRKHPYKNDL